MHVKKNSTQNLNASKNLKNSRSGDICNLQIKQQATDPHHPLEGENDDNSNFDNTDEFNPVNQFQFGGFTKNFQSFDQNSLVQNNY